MDLFGGYPRAGENLRDRYRKNDALNDRRAPQLKEVPLMPATGARRPRLAGTPINTNPGTITTGVFGIDVCCYVADLDEVWTLPETGQGTVTIYDSAARRLKGTYVTTSTDVDSPGLCYEAKRGRVWIGCRGNPVLEVVDARSRKLAATITDAGIRPNSCTYDPEADVMWVASYYENHVRRYRCADFTLIDNNGVHTQPIMFVHAPGGKTLTIWMCYWAGLFLTGFNSRRQSTAFADLDLSLPTTQSYHACYVPHEETIWIPRYGSSTFSVLSVRTEEIIATPTVANGLTTMAAFLYDPFNHLVLGLSDNANLQRYNPRTMNLVDTIPSDSTFLRGGCITPYGDCWIGSNNGVRVFDLGKRESVLFPMTAGAFG